MTSDDAKNVANDIAARAQQSAQDTKDRVAASASKIGDATKDFATRASDKAGEVYDRVDGHVRDVADRLPDSASDAVAAGQKAYRTGSERVARQVSKQPIEALLLAGAIGYLVGWAANRS